MNSFSQIISINKPKGPTSHQIINKLRKITGIKKIGHAGTLDPLASGLMIVAIGRQSTKNIEKYVKLDKVYTAIIKLGEKSSTYDAEGEIEKVDSEKKPTEHEIVLAIQNFIGEIDQVPPIFSAIKINGKRAYKLARQNKEVALTPRKIKVYKIEILEYFYPFLKLQIHCGSGTYVRSIANDLGESLGTGGYLYELVRNKIGDFNLENAYSLELFEEYWRNREQSEA